MEDDVVWEVVERRERVILVGVDGEIIGR